MKTQRIVEILKSDAVDTDVVVKGWVRTKRGNKNVAFIALNDGSSKPLQEWRLRKSTLWLRAYVQ